MIDSETFHFLDREQGFDDSGQPIDVAADAAMASGSTGVHLSNKDQDQIVQSYIDEHLFDGTCTKTKTLFLLL